MVLLDSKQDLDPKNLSYQNMRCIVPQFFPQIVQMFLRACKDDCWCVSMVRLDSKQDLDPKTYCFRQSDLPQSLLQILQIMFFYVPRCLLVCQYGPA